MKNKGKRRFYSEAEILHAIDRIQANKQRAALRAEAADQLASDLYAWCNAHPELAESDDFRSQKHSADLHRKRAQQIRSYYPRYRANLNRLKHTLAAFRTTPMTFVEQAIVLQ